MCDCGKTVKEIVSTHKYIHMYSTPHIIFHIYTHTSHAPHIQAQHHKKATIGYAELNKASQKRRYLNLAWRNEIFGQI